jgi:hypothetical protein
MIFASTLIRISILMQLDLRENGLNGRDAIIHLSNLFFGELKAQ